VRVDREQLLPHRARVKAAHDESDTTVLAGSTNHVDPFTSREAQG